MNWRELTLDNPVYTLMQKIGAGAAGEVYSAQNTDTGEKVAVKVFGTRQDISREVVESEFRLLSRLRHPHILPVLDFGCMSTGQFYWVMPLVEQVNRSDFGKNLTPEFLIEYLIQILQALDYLHQMRIIHGDIKPDNILLESNTSESKFAVKLTDFGMARVTSLGRGRSIGGSFPYLAPESLTRRSIDPRADLFSLGVTLFEMVFGEPPFNSVNEYRQLFLPDFSPPDIQWPESIRFLGDIARTLVQPDPDNRYLSARDVMMALSERSDQSQRHLLKNIETQRRGYIVDSVFTGRDEEIQLLDSTLKRLDSSGKENESSTGAVIRLIGRPGSGFTRLLQEYHLRCHTRQIPCRYYKTGNQSGYRDLVTCFQLSSETPEKHLLQNIKQKLEKNSQSHAIVYLIDDLNNGDDTFQTVINELLNKIPPGVLLVCADNRTKVENSLEATANENQVTISLKPLTENTVKKMIRSRFVPDPPDEIVNLICETGGQLPASVNHVLDTLWQIGAITWKGNQWCQKVSSQDLHSIKGLETGAEQIQLKNLSDAHRNVALQMALFGRTINIPLVKSILEFDGETFAEYLTQLRESGVIVIESNEPKFVSPGFTALSQQLLLREVRHDLHLKAAEFLQQNDGNQIETGFHFLAAEKLQSAVKHLFGGAINRIRRGSIDSGLELLAKIGAILEQKGDLELIKQYGWLLSLESGNGRMRKGDYPSAMAHYERAFDSTDDPGQKSTVLGNLAMVKLRSGKTEEALIDLEKAAHLARSAGKIGQLGVLNAQLGNLYYQQESYTHAVRAYESALPHLEKAENHRVSAAVWNNLGSVLETLGNIDQAFAAYIRAFPLKQKQGDRLGVAILRHNIGHILLERGRLKASKTQLEKACNSLQEQGEASHLIQFLGNLALADIYLGNYRAASKHLEQADPRLREIENSELLFWLVSIKGKLWLDSANPQAAHSIMLPMKEKLPAGEALSREHFFYIIRLYQAEMELGIADEKSHHILSELLTDKTDVLLHSEVLITLACYQLKNNNIPASLDYCQQAETILSSENLILKKTRTQLIQAHCYLLIRQAHKALNCLSEDIFMQLKLSNTYPLLLQWTRVVTAAYTLLGDHAAALHSAADAEAILSRIMLHLPAETDPEQFRIHHSAISLPEAPRPIVQERIKMEDRKKLTLLLEISRGLNQESDWDSLLNRIVEHALVLTGAQRGFLYLKPTREDNDILVTKNISRSEIFGSHSQISTSVLDEVMRSNRSLILNDSLNENSFKNRQSILLHNLRTIMCAPVSDHHLSSDLQTSSTASGVLYVDGTSSGPRFSALDRELFEALASHAGVGLGNLRQKQQLLNENKTLKREIKKQHCYDKLIGTSPPMLKLRSMLQRIAPTDAGVLIYGESGTGKELVASTLHYNSSRESGPFLTINCAALAESVLESELFGVESGVATGVKRRTGLFVQASSGTLFLDEVGDMPLNMQAKILRVLQERRVRPVGGKQSIDIDVRIICATNKDLWKEAKAGNFREDLLYRLDVVTLHLPPLRERLEDIPVLARTFLKKYAQEMGVPVPGIALKSYKYLSGYPWPGNVRELENQIHRALVMTDIGKDIEPESLSPRILTEGDRDQRPEEQESRETLHKSSFVQDSVSRSNQTDRCEMNLKNQVMQLEKDMIQRAMEKTGGNKTETARILGLSREGLRLKLQRLKSEIGNGNE